MPSRRCDLQLAQAEVIAINTPSIDSCDVHLVKISVGLVILVIFTWKLFRETCVIE